MTGFIDNFFYNLSGSPSIIALSLICPLHKSLPHAIRFLATDLSQELSPFSGSMNKPSKETA
jgi:hypothetical protein